MLLALPPLFILLAVDYLRSWIIKIWDSTGFITHLNIDLLVREHIILSSLVKGTLSHIHGDFGCHSILPSVHTCMLLWLVISWKDSSVSRHVHFCRGITLNLFNFCAIQFFLAILSLLIRLVVYGVIESFRHSEDRRNLIIHAMALSLSEQFSLKHQASFPV